MKKIREFIHDARAGATAIAAAATTFMTVCAAALIVDHVWLVDQRDMLKTGADAAAIATTLELQTLPYSMSDGDAESALHATADRYVRLNLDGNLSERARQKMNETLVVSIDVNRDLGTVGVSAQADLGGTLLSKWFLDYPGPEDGVSVMAGAEGSVNASELVLVIDVTSSMLDNLDGVRVDSGDPTSRINIVKRAAEDLVDILSSHESSTIAVGLVPWTYRVRLDQPTRTRWKTHGWAVYPTERTYPHPTRGPPGSDRYLPETQSLPAKSRLPEVCRAWAGCLDRRVVNGQSNASPPPSFSTARPSAEPFVMNYFTHETSYPDRQYASFACQDYTRAESRAQGGEEPLCYDLDRVPSGQDMCQDGDIQPGGPWRVKPQDNCNASAIRPLDTHLSAVRTAIRGLRASGSATYSSAGIAWGIRLLDSSWRDVWDHPVHPMEEDTGVQKVIVLLTDGEDNHLTNAHAHRQHGCTAAKNAGIVIFTIAAMSPDNVGDSLARELTKCSSQDDDPDGNYVFINNTTPDQLREAFAGIARQMVSLRRTY